MTSFLVYPHGTWITIQDPESGTVARTADHDSISVTNSDGKRVPFGVHIMSRKREVDVVKGESTLTGVLVRVDERDNVVLEAEGEQTVTKYDTISTDPEDDRGAYIITWEDDVGAVTLTYFTPAIKWKPTVDIVAENNQRAMFTLSAVLDSEFWSPIEGKFELIVRPSIRGALKDNIVACGDVGHSDGSICPLDILVGQLSLEGRCVKPISTHEVSYQVVNIVDLTTVSCEGQGTLALVTHAPGYAPGASYTVTYLKHKDMFPLPSYQKDALMILPLYKSRSIKYCQEVVYNKDKGYVFTIKIYNTSSNDADVLFSFDASKHTVTETVPAVAAELASAGRVRWLRPCKKGECTVTFQIVTR